jgi:hypothetical protein
MDCFQESRTRAPSRLSRMWTTLLLARLGEISIVLHAGVVRAERQEDEDVGTATFGDNATVMEEERVMVRRVQRCAPAIVQ